MFGPPNDDTALTVAIRRIPCDTKGFGLTTQVGDGLCQRLGLAGGDDDPSTFGNQLLGDAEPDAPRGAGDDGHRALVDPHVRDRGPGR